MPVALVSDTCHYLPAEVVERCGIHSVSLYVQSGEQTRRESEILDYDAYYEDLASMEDLPTTSQPSVGDFLTVYEPLLASGYEIISIHLSGGLSGTVRAAEQAVSALGDDGSRVTVIDSVTACGAEGLMLIAAAAAIAAGADAAGAVAQARAAHDELGFLFALDTLEYLHRGGRIGGARAWLGSTLQIKPILSVESEIREVERVRTSGRAFDRLVRLLQEQKADGREAWVVQHAHAPERAQAMVERGREIFGCEPVFVSEVGPVIGTHTGPGLLGVGALPARLV